MTVPDTGWVTAEPSTFSAFAAVAQGTEVDPRLIVLGIAIGGTLMLAPGFVTDFGDLAPFKKFLDTELPRLVKELVTEERAEGTGGGP